MQEEDQLIVTHTKQVVDINETDDVSRKEAKSKRKKWIIIGLIIAALAILIIVLAVTLSKKKDPEPGPGPSPGPIPEGYNPYKANVTTINPSTQSGYLLFEQPSSAQSMFSSFASLGASNLRGPADIGVDATKIPTGNNNQVIRNVSFVVGMPSYKTAYMKLWDSNNTRYVVPDEAVPSTGFDATMRLEQIGFSLSTDKFGFSFTDINDQNNVFIDTRGQTFLMSDKYIQIDFKLPSQKLFGFGERVHEFGLTQGAWTMWASGQDLYDDGMGGKNSYGVHPFVMIQGKNPTQFVGIYFRNSNAQSPVLKFKDDGTSVLSYITTGGILEMYFYVYGTPKIIIQQYHNSIGFPVLPPFWALGWHQASWKYINQPQVEKVIENYSLAGLPLETIWLDIPYMNNYADFTVDTTAFPNLKALGDSLHSRNQHIVVIIDAALSAVDPNDPYVLAAKNANSLIMSNVTKDVLYQKVWPQKAVFLDWFSKQIGKVWGQGLQDLYQKVPYDGLWLDMNEASCFNQGEIYPNKLSEEEGPEAEEQIASVKRFLQENNNRWFDSYSNQTNISTYDLPFIPGSFNNSDFTRFDNLSISLNATHPSNGMSEYDLHNLYGHMMAKRTFEYLTNTSDSFNTDPNIFPNTDKRAFLLSRSTFSSSGQWASHWTGDNYRDWSYLRYSISGIMNMNMFGIPLTGSDICGFFGGQKDDEMCARWIQLATFYPFARVHQNQTYFGNVSNDTEPYNLQGEWLQVAKESYFNRYEYIRQMYTCLFEITQWGGSCFDPLFYYYPEDSNTYNKIEDTFIVSSALKVSPILDANVTQFQSYFPQGRWVDLQDYSVIDASDKGDYKTLNISRTVKTHLRPGSIIVKQENPDKKYNSTSDVLSKIPHTLIANRDKFGAASGSLFLDSGDSRAELFNNHNYEYIQFQLQQNSILRTNAGGNEGSRNGTFYKFIITDAPDLQNTSFACALGNDMSSTPLTILNNNGANTVTLSSPTPIKFSDIRQISFGNATDINLCDASGLKYKVVGDAQPFLSQTNVSFQIQPLNSKLPWLNVSLSVDTTTSTMINVKWTFNSTYNGKRPYEVPNDIVGNVDSSKSSVFLKNFVDIALNPFSLTIHTVDGAKVFSIDGLLLDNYLNVISAQLVTQKGDSFKGIFGLGERVGPNIFYPDGVYSMWARDVASPIETGKAPGNNLYGTHPFYAYQVNADVWAGVFTKLAAAQDWWIKNDKVNGAISMKTMAAGGMADITVIIDKSPKLVIQNYWKLVGSPVLTPQFALGWNQCRWGYNTTQALHDVVNNYSAANIPLDVQWSDIDYLNNYRDFTYDPVNFADLPNFIEGLHNKSMHYVPIIDAGVAKRVKGQYPAYDDGHDKDIFIKINNNQEMIGKVWPGDAVFPDFFNDKTSGWWQSQLSNLYKNIKFDGLWQDMNEASDFCDGVCYPEQKPADQVKHHLKYQPTGRDLESQSMPLDAYQANGYTQLDTHSFYGTQQVKASHEWFLSQNKRTFIIERSSFAGMGKFASRWLGDNFSTIDYLHYSVKGTMMMGMFGIPLAGSDICGFIGDTNPELCARWTVVGSFYPFSRNHNNNGQVSQEPYVFAKTIYEGTITYTDIMQRAIRNRYHMIRYYYTQMSLMSDVNQTAAREGTLLYQPLFFEFPNDPVAYNDIQNNVMLGSALKLSVRADALSVNTTTFYFPAGTWCNVFNTTEPCFDAANGKSIEMRTKAYDFYVHLRSGNVVPMQDATLLNINTTAQLQNEPVDFHMLPQVSVDGKTWAATGLYYNDDGAVLNTTGNSNLYKLTLAGTVAVPGFTLTIQNLTTATNMVKPGQACSMVNMNDYLGSLYIYNADVTALNKSYKVTVTWETKGSFDVGTATYDATSRRVVFVAQRALGLCLSAIAQLTFTPIA